MTTFTTGAGLKSAPRAVPRGAIVTVTPGSGASAVVESTNASAAEVANNVAVWAAWPNGIVSGKPSSLLANDSIFVRVTASGGAVSCEIDESPTARTLAPFLSDWGSASASSSSGSGVSVVSQQGPLLFLGDSLTQQSTGRVPIDTDGRAWHMVTNLDYTQLGGNSWETSWISFCRMDGRAPSNVTFTVDTDGQRRLRLTIGGDTAGAWVDVSKGGFYLLSSGTSPYQLMVAVRNADGTFMTPPTVAGSGAGTVTSSGSSPPELQSFNLTGYGAWVAGALGDTFSDYVMWGIGGDYTENLLSRIDQALSTANPAAVALLIGTNDRPGTSAAVLASVGRITAIIDRCRATGVPVYVADILPRGNETDTIKKNLALMSSLVEQYCRGKGMVRFWSAYDQMADPQADAGALLTAAYHTDLVHLMPFGGYRASLELVRMISHDFGVNKTRKALLDTYDAALGVGAWNPNPNLRGTAGTISANNRVTGVVPTGWGITGGLGTGVGTQTCVGAFEADPSGGPSWFTMEVANSGTNDFHQLFQNGINFPAEVAVGDKFRIVVEVKIFAATNLYRLRAHAHINGLLTQLVAFTASRNVSTFTAEQPALTFVSAPMSRNAAMTSISLSFSVGGTGSSSGKVGIRTFRIERA
ncbi:GDSL-type esterase/lipase family protein [Pseudoduganella sp. SL102]|uniref:SGNH/GDSL hydrolase family protein n=1 Tax=Pseudoduganella sp. SL102 TaxID=2995154 RepID=UPI00248BD2B0|nr:GDSL-type esterase/lipase family protein [Pseudoduganella sp. SL102]WBS00229.1 GDSL-type esterase/lipase family protein [Pseudoduganella sp. SL102]